MTPIRVDVSSSECPFDVMRALVEAGTPDGPVVVYVDGRESLRVRSLLWGAGRDVRETPTVAFVAFRESPYRKVGPRVAALLTQQAAERAERREARAKKRKEAP